MPAGENDRRLLQGASGGNFDLVKAALQAGASVDGPPEQPCAPIVAATIADHAGIIELLLEHGADPDRPVTEELPHPTSDMAAAVAGERALHIATRNGNIEIVRLLLEQARANPNATDDKGGTPLLAACDSSNIEVEVVRLLLEAGADPTLAEKNGIVPLHVVAYLGYVDLVGTLHSRAPATLNRSASKGQTPLFLACTGGHESVVSQLLSLGAMQPVPADDSNSMLPLTTAVSKGFLGVVRVLINERGIRAIGGWTAALPSALCTAVQAHQARILRLLLAASGEDRRSEWANTNVKGRHLLHYAAGYCCHAAVGVLLEAGAGEAARDSEGRIPRDVVGVDIGRGDGVRIDRGKEDDIRRMLQLAPAYRARSWAWVSDEDADAGGGGGGATSSAGISSPPAVPKAPLTGLRIFRPKEKNSNDSSKRFVALVGRYCEKD